MHDWADKKARLQFDLLLIFLNELKLVQRVIAIESTTSCFFSGYFTPIVLEGRKSDLKIFKPCRVVCVSIWMRNCMIWPC
jgi:hypothetical protein